MKPANLQEFLDLTELLKETALLLWKDWPRNMRVRILDQQAATFVMMGDCPHCQRAVQFKIVTGTYVESPYSARTKVIAGMQCQGCQKYILATVIYAPGNAGMEYVEHYPLGKPDQVDMNEIPAAILADYNEALRCLWVDAYNATAEMCRRALEATCIDLKAPVTGTLEDMIDWLEAQRKITPQLKDIAHKVRLGGNRAAHPPVNPTGGNQGQSQAAPVEKIEKDHANAIVGFTSHFLQHVYVVPNQLDKYDFSKPKVTKAKP